MIARSPKLGKTQTRRTTSADLDPVCLARFAALTADEPTPPLDGTCAMCGQPRRPERSRRYAHGCADIDPFCSATCARAFHNNPCPDTSYVGLRYRRDHVRSWESVSGAERQRRIRAQRKEAA